MKSFTITEQNKFKRKPLLSLLLYSASAVMPPLHRASGIRVSAEVLLGVFLTIPAVAWHKRYTHLALPKRLVKYVIRSSKF